MIATELRTLLRLAWPLVLGYAGSQLMSMTDAAMVGRLGAEALAGVGIGNGIYFTVTCLGFGCVAGMEAPVAQAVGAGERGRARRLVWQGVRVAVLASLPLVVVMALLPLALPSFGIDIVTASVVGIIANAVGNWLLIYRAGLGVAGSGIASTLAAAAMVAALAPAVSAVDAPPDPARRAFDPALVRTILRLGVPNGLQVVAEVGVFATVGVLAGRIGATSAAAHLVAITLASFTFCVTLGIGAASATGCRRRRRARCAAPAIRTRRCTPTSSDIGRSGCRSPSRSAFTRIRAQPDCGGACRSASRRWRWRSSGDSCG